MKPHAATPSCILGLIRPPAHSCLRNVVALFHVLEKELAWRKHTGRPEGYGAMKASKPIVAVGPEHSLDDEVLMADYFRTLPLEHAGSRAAGG